MEIVKSDKYSSIDIKIAERAKITVEYWNFKDDEEKAEISLIVENDSSNCYSCGGGLDFDLKFTLKDLEMLQKKIEEIIKELKNEQTS